MGLQNIKTTQLFPPLNENSKESELVPKKSTSYNNLEENKSVNNNSTFNANLNKSSNILIKNKPPVYLNNHMKCTSSIISKKMPTIEVIPQSNTPKSLNLIEKKA